MKSTEELRAYKREWMRRKRGYEAPRERACAVCSLVFLPPPSHPKAATCSRRCSSRLEYRTHSSSYKSRTAQWARSNPDLFKQYVKRSQGKNPAMYRDIWRLKQHRRNANLRKVEGNGISKDEWAGLVDSQEQKCFWCGMPTNRLTIDHVIPIAKRGAHDIHNVVGACKSCNSRKRDRFWPMELGRLFIGPRRIGVQINGRFPVGAPSDEVRQVFRDGGMAQVWAEIEKR